MGRRSTTGYTVWPVMSASASTGPGLNCEIDVMGHVWTAPGWQVLSSRVQEWSWQPCVRPVSAVHVTAGHYSEVCEMSVNSLVYLLSEVPTFPESRIGKAMGSSGSQSFSGDTGVTSDSGVASIICAGV